MTARYSKHFLQQYASAPASVRKAFDKPWRFYFPIEGDVYHLHEIVAHPK